MEMYGFIKFCNRINMPGYCCIQTITMITGARITDIYVFVLGAQTFIRAHNINIFKINQNTSGKSKEKLINLVWP